MVSFHGRASVNSSVKLANEIMNKGVGHKDIDVSPYGLSVYVRIRQ